MCNTAHCTITACNITHNSLFFGHNDNNNNKRDGDTLQCTTKLQFVSIAIAATLIIPPLKSLLSMMLCATILGWTHGTTLKMHAMLHAMLHD